MNTASFNDYVLNASHEAGWITDEQQQLVSDFLQRSPGVAALDFMVEQQLLNEQRAKTLADLIRQAVIQQGGDPAELDRPAAAPKTTAPNSADPLRPENLPSATVHVQAADFDLSVQQAHLHDYLKYAVEIEASDVHLGPDFPPLLRYNGGLIPFREDSPKLTPEQTEALAREFLTAKQCERVEEMGSVDFCYEAPDLARFRSSVVRQRRGWESVFRVISTRVRTMEELGLPKVMYELIKYHNGLILVTGSVGSGKTTTLAALVNEINKERRDHIITLEDPIEYVFQPSGCQITQREVHSHTESFSTALRASLRQDPDVIMVGEMRDLETISLAITASETGHLVLATLHTSNASRTMQRLLDVFPVEQQAQIRTMVSESIRGIVCQQLVPRLDGKGRVLALEIMTNTPAIANLIREGKNFMLPGQMQIGRRQGMRLMDDSLLELFNQGLIAADETYERAENKKVMAAALAGRTQ